MINYAKFLIAGFFKENYDCTINGTGFHGRGGGGDYFDI